MALASYAIPFGLRQVKLVPLNDAGVEVTANAVTLPASRTFTFTEQEDFETLEGDDTTVASHGAGPKVAWELEGGGISLDVWKTLGGGTVATSGSTPNAIKTFTKLKTDSRPYFNVYGRAISDNGGDFEAIVYRCKADGDLEGSMENGSFLLTSASGTGFGNDTDGKLYVFRHKETAAPLANPSAKTNWTVAFTGSPTGGTFKLYLNGYQTAALAYNITAANLAAALNALAAQTGLNGITATGTGPIAVTLPSAGYLWGDDGISLTPNTAAMTVS